VYYIAQLSLALSFTGSCSQQATSALGNGMVADLQPLLLPIANTSASVKAGVCTGSNKRVGAANATCRNRTQLLCSSATTCSRVNGYGACAFNAQYLTLAV
jgi:hypothetical protein